MQIWLVDTNESMVETMARNKADKGGRTWAEWKEYLQRNLKNSDDWCLRAFVVIYNKQTETEKASGSTLHYNKVGFTGADAEILTSFAKQYQRKGNLTPKQMAILRNKMPKYWKQLAKVAIEKQQVE